MKSDPETKLQSGDEKYSSENWFKTHDYIVHLGKSTMLTHISWALSLATFVMKIYTPMHHF